MLRVPQARVSAKEHTAGRSSRSIRAKSPCLVFLLFKDLRDVSSKLDALTLIFARLLSGSLQPISSQRQHSHIRIVVQVILGEVRAAERCGEAGGIYPEWGKVGKPDILSTF